MYVSDLSKYGIEPGLDLYKLCHKHQNFPKRVFETDV